MVHLHDLFGSVAEVLFDLRVAELEDLQPIVVGGLRGLGLSKVVHYLQVRVRLLDVIIVKVHDGVSVWEGLSSDAVAEDDLFLSIHVRPLDLTVVAYKLLSHCIVVVVGGAMILLQHFHLEVLLLSIVLLRAFFLFVLLVVDLGDIVDRVLALHLLLVIVVS